MIVHIHEPVYLIDEQTTDIFLEQTKIKLFSHSDKPGHSVVDYTFCFWI